MKCPTCEGAKENHCCCCGVKILKDKQELEADPFADEIHYDDRKHLQCDFCRWQSCQDI